MIWHDSLLLVHQSVRFVVITRCIQAHSKFTCRWCLGWLLGHILPQVLLRFRWWNSARPRRNAVSHIVWASPSTHHSHHHANRAPKSAALFVSIVIKAPICQVLVMLSGAALLALEWPLPALKQLSIHRAMILRPVMLLFQAFFAILFYQVRVAPCG